MGGLRKKGEEHISKLFWLNDHFNSIVLTDNKQDWRMSVWNLCLEWRNFAEQEVGFQFAQASNECFWVFFLFFFFFPTFPNKNKTVFLCAVQMVPSCSLTVLFLLFFFFFLLKGKTQREKILGWHFVGTNFWIQNLPGGVARLVVWGFLVWFCFALLVIFFNRKTDDVKREQVVMNTNCLPQKLSYSLSLILFFFLF